jgi:hypothetical protein
MLIEAFVAVDDAGIACGKGRIMRLLSEKRM